MYSVKLPVKTAIDPVRVAENSVSGILSADVHVQDYGNESKVKNT